MRTRNTLTLLTLTFLGIWLGFLITVFAVTKSDDNVDKKQPGLPLIIHPSEDLEEEFLVAAEKAAETWNKATGVNAVYISRTRTDLIGGPWSSESFDGLYSVTKDEFEKNINVPDAMKKSLAVTRNYFSRSTGIISMSKIVFVKEYAKEGYDAESIALHEIGHALGLRHSKNLNSIMFEKVYKNEIKRELTQEDVDNFKKKYQK